MEGRLLALFVEASLRGEISDWVVVGYVYFVLFSNNCIEVGGEDVAETGADYYDVVFLKVAGGSFSLFSEPERIGIPGEELCGCDFTH